MTTLSLRLFGSPQVFVDDVPVSIPRVKASALLFYLAATEVAHQRNHLATLLWPEFENAAARTYLRQALYALTTALGAQWFQSSREQICLLPQEGLRVDIHDFHALASGTQVASTSGAAVRQWVLAAELAREPFLAGFSPADAPPFDDWLFFQREALERKTAVLLTRLISHFTQQQRFDDALRYARRRLALDSLDEASHQMLMRLYADAGQKGLALRQYAQCEQLLGAEMGVAPSSDTVLLYEAIRDEQYPQDTRCATSGSTARALLPSDITELTSRAFSSLRRTGVGLHNLPEQPTRFIGRQAEREQLAALLADEATRQITIVAPGGMGKTRLALAVAREHVRSRMFADGVCFVPLATVTDAVDVASAVAASLGISVQSGGAEHRSIATQLCDFLAAKHLLLILDNFEHILDSTPLLDAILRVAPSVKVLVTSRERLGMQGEQAVPIQGLDFGHVHSEYPGDAGLLERDAVRLFQQCARLVAPEFVVDTQNLPHVLDICRLVDGMPLGLELAATWIGSLAPADIAEEIRTNLDFLAAGYRDMPARHRSIRAVFDSTWQRMTEADQVVFAALSVFRSGFSREAAREVSGTTLRQLNNLVAKSLIEYDRVRRTYAIHELLRQYGAAQLSSTPDVAARVRKRHSAYYLSFLAERQQAINTVGQGLVADAIGREFPNVRAAWRRRTEQATVNAGDVEALLRAAPTLFIFCQIRSRFVEGAELQQEAAAWLRRAEPSPLRARTLAQVLNHEGWLRIRLGDFARAESALSESRRLYAALGAPPQPYTGSDPATGLAVIYEIQGHYAEAIALGEAARVAAEANQDPFNLAHAHYVLTSTLAAQGDYTRAAAHAAQSCEAARSVGNRWFLSIPLIEWGKVARAMGDLTQARTHFQTSYELKREFGDPEGMAVTLCHLGEVAVMQAQYDEAEALFRAALALYQDINDRGGLATAWHGLGTVAVGRNEVAQAGAWLAQALALAVETHFWPLVFTIIVAAGELICRNDDLAGGIELLAYVRHHPGADREVADTAARHLAVFSRHADDPDVVEAAVARGEALMWEAALMRVRQHLAASADGAPGDVPG
jgi:predicted ATPase/DNA-binding SARP family transcriptional activator